MAVSAMDRCRTKRDALPPTLIETYEDVAEAVESVAGLCARHTPAGVREGRPVDAPGAGTRLI